MSLFVPMPALAFSQLFFPVKGILCVLDRETGQFRVLPGADDPRFVQTNANWSPDGKYIVFARAKAYSDYSQLCLTHIDENGCSTPPPVLLEHLTAPDRAANIPESVNAHPESIARIHERFLND